ncbi:hypothetical protein ACFXPZ_36585 [Streptomyces sp. NPDC059101]|uniref:hypothetical protein n=1 Tax=Streptomyces sp. NPDC059101 TaxID=3346728 RepID=UPI0036D0D21F
MPSARPSVLYVTDLAYEARGRRYGDEDVFLSSRLRDTFTVALCHPLDAVALMDAFDAVVVRNSGPVLHYQAAYEDFRARALSHGVRVYNPLTGKADMAGKQYLLDLTAAGLPVIPTVDRRADVDRLPQADAYVAKPKAGADSLGLRVLTRDALDGLDGLDSGDVLIQPRVDFRYEVSFYFVDRAFQYALRTTDPDRRWDLAPYQSTDDDLAFAQRFVDWNGLDHGIQRVDACRTRDGRLLLVELEDLNPYLSLDRLAPDDRDAFVGALKTSLLRFTRPR